MQALQLPAVALAAALLVGCGTEVADPAGARTSEGRDDGGTTETAQASDGATIPDGTWVKSFNLKDARRLGIPAPLARRGMPSDGENYSELRFDGASFAQFSEDGDAGRGLGDGGTVDYDDEGNVVLTSASEGCRGCWVKSRWTVDGDELTLEVVDFGNTDESPVELLVGRLMMEGTFVRQ